MTSKKQSHLDQLNREIKKCSSCPLSLSRHHVLTGEGDIDSPLMVIALSPGKKEDLENRMFVGPSGKVFNRLLGHAGIQRESIYMTNLIKCTLPKNRRPKMAEIASCSRFLDQEISIIDQDWIVPLGFYAGRYILNKFKANPPEARKDFSHVYGQLILSDNKKILPLPHPASLLYNPAFEPETSQKYAILKTLLQQCQWYPSCPMKRYNEQGKLERKWIEKYCKGNWKSCIRYQLEENGTPHPDYMLPDGSLDLRLK